MIQNRPECGERRGVTIHRQEKCFRGYTLYWGRNEGRANLIDMAGAVVHEWTYADGGIWHHADMLPNGNILALVNDGGGYSPKVNIRRRLVELDWDSRLVWWDPVHAHHDARRLANGNTLTAAHDRAQYRHISPKVLIYDYIEEIAPDNRVVWEWHAAAHVDELEALVDLVRRDWQGDWPHINTVEELPDTPLGRQDGRFRAGNILVSARHLHCIWIIEKTTGRIVWAWGPGEILGQHQPTMLANGNILLFDNGHGNAPDEDCGHSRVIEIEPAAGRIVWQYAADPPEAFWTPIGSGQQRLPNGNTLICAMNWDQVGRIFEVTPDGEIVWEFWDPEGQALYRATRYPPPWVEPRLGPGRARPNPAPTVPSG